MLKPELIALLGLAAASGLDMPVPSTTTKEQDPEEAKELLSKAEQKRQRRQAKLLAQTSQ